VFLHKNFLCHEGPKIIQDFRDETHFFIIKRDFIHKFHSLKRSSITFDFFNNSPPSPEIFSCTGFFVFFYISSWILFTTFKTNYLVMECLTSTGFFNPVESFWRSPFFCTFNQGFPITDFKRRALYKTFFGLLQLWRGINDCFNTTLSWRNIFHLTCARVILHPSTEAEHLLKE
jgi:hypothetical protein